MKNSVSRTKRTIQNARISFLLFLVQILIGFYSRKIFLDYLGTEVLGLNTTLGNILSFMNLAELGIGIAMATSLYKPINNNDQESICEIITVQGILYRRIAFFICGVGAIVMFLLPYLFPSTECGITYVFISFIVFLSGSIFSYLWNYKQILIGADQKNFKLLPWIHGVRYSKVGLQILCLTIFHWGIWGWIFWEFCGNIVLTIAINFIMRKEYPWLHTIDCKKDILLKKYHHLLTKTKQLFVHKLAYFILEQTAPLIIYGYVSLTMVTYYGNYMLILGYVSTLVNVIFDGMGASIGSLVADNNRTHIINVFWELFTSRIWIASIACIGLFYFTSPFISLWIGHDYILSDTTLLLLVISVFIKMSRGVVDSFKDAYQLFGDVWAPIIEAIINLGCSIILGSIWGLNGILIGSNLSLIFIVVLWKPYYLLKNGLKESCINYFIRYLYHILVIATCAYISTLYLGLFLSDNLLIFITHRIIGFILYIVTSFCLLFVSTQGMKLFSKRIISIISQKI